MATKNRIRGLGLLWEGLLAPMGIATRMSLTQEWKGYPVFCERGF
jgi:hypothetical protein